MSAKYTELKDAFNELKIKHEMLVLKVSHGCTDATCTECDSIRGKILCENDTTQSGIVACDGCGAYIHVGDVFYDSRGGWGAACSIDCIRKLRSFVMVYRNKTQRLADPPSTCVIEGEGLESVEEIFEHSYADCDLLWVVEGTNPAEAINDWLNGGEA